MSNKYELEQFNKDIQLRRQQAAAIMPSSVSSEALDERRAKILTISIFRKIHLV